MWFFLNLYLQQVLGYGAFDGGAALLPMTVTIMVLMVVVAPRVIARLGPKAPIVAGMLILGAGMAVLSLVRADGTFAADVLPASLLPAAGISLAFIPSLGTAISSAKPEEGGLASGIVNTAYQVGSALGLAAMTALATSQGADHLGNPSALTDGYSAAFIGAAGIAVGAPCSLPRRCGHPRPWPPTRRIPARTRRSRRERSARGAAEDAASPPGATVETEGSTMPESQSRYVAAAGRAAFSGAYDAVVALTMRERLWRPLLVARIAGHVRSDGRIVDVGAGRGSRSARRGRERAQGRWP